MIQSAVGSLLFSSGSWCTQDLVCALQDWSLYFPQSCGSLIIKSQCLSRSEFQGFPVPLSDPQVGSLTRDFEPLQQWANFFGIIVLQLVGHPPVGMGFDFILIVPLLPSHCSFFFVFAQGVSVFGGLQCPPVDDGSTASFHFGALTGDVCTSFSCTVLKQKTQHIVFTQLLFIES